MSDIDEKIQKGLRLINRQVKRDLKKDYYHFSLIEPRKINHYIDIGANQGIVFLWLLKHGFLFQNSILLEPHTLIFSKLKQNVEKTNAILINKCFGDGVGDLRLSFFKHNKIGATKYRTVGSGESSPTISLLEIFQNYSIDFSKTIIKCDCEGGEEWFLSEKNKVFLPEVYFLTMEFHGYCENIFDKLCGIMEKTHEIKRGEKNKAGHSSLYFLKSS